MGHRDLVSCTRFRRGAWRGPVRLPMLFHTCFDKLAEVSVAQPPSAGAVARTQPRAAVPQGPTLRMSVVRPRVRLAFEYVLGCHH